MPAIFAFDNIQFCGIIYYMKHLITITITFLMLTALWAQERETYTLQYLQSYPETVSKGIAAPLQWQCKEWIGAGAIALSLGALYFADDDLRELFQASRSPGTDRFMNITTNFGDYQIIVPTIGISILSAYLLEDDKAYDTALLSMKSLVLSSCLSLSLKLSTQRNRPSEGKGKEFWADGGFSTKKDSFPSGHATVVWSIAPLLAEQYQDNSWLPPVAYGVAFLTSLSRIYTDAHWASDVLAGAVIGYTTARLVQSSTPRMQIITLPGLKGVGIAYRF